MSDSTALEILKSAILLERRGRAFYTKVAEQTQSDAAKRFFNMMADEEEKHVGILSEHFKNYQQKKTFGPTEYDHTPSDSLSSRVLTEDLKEQLSAADFEAAAISAAMSMEKNAIALYSKRAEAADDPDEKSLYKWLADWEKTHLNFLAEIDKELTENIWHDNNFWPF
mgnify:CR=1 FL=1